MSAVDSRRVQSPRRARQQPSEPRNLPGFYKLQLFLCILCRESVVTFAPHGPVGPCRVRRTIPAHDSSDSRFVWSISLRAIHQRLHLVRDLPQRTGKAAAFGFLPPTAFPVWRFSGSSLISSRTSSLTNKCPAVTSGRARLRKAVEVYLHFGFLNPRSPTFSTLLRTCYNERP